MGSGASLWVAVVLCAGVAIVSCRPASETRPQGEPVQVQFESNPRSAVVLVDDAIACRGTPCVATIPAGPREVAILLERHAPRTELVVISPESAKVEWELTPTFGLVSVSSEPSGLPVSVAGRMVGRTPVRRIATDAGAVEIKIVDPCHVSPTETVQLAPGQHHVAALEVNKLVYSVQFSPVLAGQPSEAKVYLDGRVIGEAPGTLDVPGCSKWLRFAAERGEALVPVASLSESGATRRVVMTPVPSGLSFRVVPAGSFQMGSPLAEVGRQADEVPHKVTLTRSFLAQNAEVTRGQWTELMGTKQQHDGCSDCPVSDVNFAEAAAFANALSTQAGYPTCYDISGCTGRAGDGMTCARPVPAAPLDCAGFRLPTEAEWEYAARGGSKTPPSPGASAWYASNSGNKLHPVRTRAANGFGLHDMLGNVFEWTQDWSAPYDAAEQTDPTGPKTGKVRAVRGGCFSYPSSLVRPAYRDAAGPEQRLPRLGFRLVRTLK